MSDRNNKIGNVFFSLSNSEVGKANRIVEKTVNSLRTDIHVHNVQPGPTDGNFGEQHHGDGGAEEEGKT